MRLALLLVVLCVLSLHGHAHGHRFLTRRRNTDDPAPPGGPAPAPAAGAPPPAGGAPPAAGAPAPASPGAPALTDPSSADAAIAGLTVKPSDAFDNGASLNSPYAQDLDIKLSRAADLLNKMQTDVTTEKDWAKSVHDIIENYQFKYSKSLSDIAEREKRVTKLKEVKDQLTQARLHTGVEEDMDKATKDLDDLTSRLGADAPASKDYSDLKNKVTKIKKKLDALSPSRAVNTKDVDQKLNDAVAPLIPPASNDALTPLVNGAADAVAAADKASAEDGSPAAAGGAAAPAAAAPAAAADS